MVGCLNLQFRLLCDAVLNFQNNQEEVTLTVSPEKICLRNYVEDEPGRTLFKLKYISLSCRWI